MVLVSRRPDIFRTAENLRNECGAYQLRAILNAFGQDALPHELYWSDWMRRRDWSLPPFMPSILRRYDIRARWRFWSKSAFSRRVLDELENDRPVTFVLYGIRGRLHWISIWGHDEATDEFLCYDSQAPESRDAPGNTRYATDLLLSRLPWRGTFTLTIKGDVH